MKFITGIGIKAWVYISIFFTILGIAIKLYKAGGDKEKQKIQIEMLTKSVDSLRRRNEIEDDVDNLSDDDVISRLRENGWIRRD